MQIRGIFFRRPPSRHDSSSSSLPAFLLSPLLCPAGYIRTILLCSGYCICVCSAIPINTINWLKIPGNIYSFSNSFRFLFFKNSSSDRGRAGVWLERSRQSNATLATFRIDGRWIHPFGFRTLADCDWREPSAMRDNGTEDNGHDDCLRNREESEKFPNREKRQSRRVTFSVSRPGASDLSR